MPQGNRVFCIGRPTAIGMMEGPKAMTSVDRFTSKERDAETGLDYFGARYLSAAQGRFTSPDPLLASGRVENPQTWNRYAYVLNNPLRLIDRTGLYEEDYTGI